MDNTQRQGQQAQTGAEEPQGNTQNPQSQAQNPETTRSYAMLAKPVSDACNLRCSYCYYTDKASLLHMQARHMSLEVLEAYICQSFAMHGQDAVVDFAWHGGEPLLAGMDFYRHVLRLQKRYGQGRHILNTLQSNGTGISEEWCHFFKDAGFLLGVSLDGPEDVHNAYRKTVQGGGSFAKTMRGVELLQKHGIPFNTLTTVNRANMYRAHEVYHFLQTLTDHMQFLPVVEVVEVVESMESMGNANMQIEPSNPTGSTQTTGPTKTTGSTKTTGINMPPGIHGTKASPILASYSVSPEGFGTFLCTLWDTWQAHRPDTKHIQLFDVILAALQGIPSELCMHSALCGHSGCVEVNGDIYSCDRYAFPAYRLGNIMERDLGQIMEENRHFGMHKTYGLAPMCFDCPYITLCFGGCPKDRLVDGKNYLCAGYRQLFAKITNS